MGFWDFLKPKPKPQPAPQPAPSPKPQPFVPVDYQPPKITPSQAEQYRKEEQAYYKKINYKGGSSYSVPVGATQQQIQQAQQTAEVIPITPEKRVEYVKAKTLSPATTTQKTYSVPTHLLATQTTPPQRSTALSYAPAQPKDYSKSKAYSMWDYVSGGSLTLKGLEKEQEKLNVDIERFNVQYGGRELTTESEYKTAVAKQTYLESEQERISSGIEKIETDKNLYRTFLYGTKEMRTGEIKVLTGTVPITPAISPFKVKTKVEFLGTQKMEGEKAITTIFFKTDKFTKGIARGYTTTKGKTSVTISAGKSVQMGREFPTAKEVSSGGTVFAGIEKGVKIGKDIQISKGISFASKDIRPLKPRLDIFGTVSKSLTKKEKTLVVGKSVSLIKDEVKFLGIIKNIQRPSGTSRVVYGGTPKQIFDKQTLNKVFSSVAGSISKTKTPSFVRQPFPITQIKTKTTKVKTQIKDIPQFTEVQTGKGFTLLSTTKESTTKEKTLKGRGFVYSPAVMQTSVQKTVPIQSGIQTFTPRTIQSQKISNLSKPIKPLKPVSPTVPIVPTRPSIPTFFLPPLPFKGERAFFGGDIKSKRSYSYFPSFGALAFGIRGKGKLPSPTKRWTGLEVRPIYDHKKRRKDLIFPEIKL